MKINSISLFAVLLLTTSVSLRAHTTPTGPPTLDTAYIVFHTKDDDKDHDSYETVTVTVGQYKVGNLSNAGAGTRWKDQSDTPPLYLDNIDKGIEPSDCGKVHVDINHSTNGNDNWKFTYTVVLTFTDGKTFTYEHGAKETLTKDNGHGAWDDDKTN
jgi:hypothetical protein